MVLYIPGCAGFLPSTVSLLDILFGLLDSVDCYWTCVGFCLFCWGCFEWRFIRFLPQSFLQWKMGVSAIDSSYLLKHTAISFIGPWWWEKEQGFGVPIFCCTKKRSMSIRLCVFLSKKHPAKWATKRGRFVYLRAKRSYCFKTSCKIGCKKRELNYLLRKK